MDLIKNLNGKILIQNKRIYFNNYLCQVIYKILYSLKNSYKGNLILTLDKNRIESLLLIIIGAKIYFENLTNHEGNILDELEVGDIVWFEGKRCEYGGIKNMYGQNKIKLRYKPRKIKNMDLENSRYIDIKDLSKISKCYGDPATLNTMSEIKSKKKNSGKIIFTKLLDLDCEELYGLIQERVVVVFESKRHMEYILQNIKIEIESVQYDFTQVFPCKYYTDVDNGMYLSGNKYKEKEIFLFTTRLDIAKELLIDNKDCKRLVLLGESTYKNHLGGIFDNLISRLLRKKLDNLIIYNSFDDINNVNKILDYDIDIYSWNKSILKDRIKNEHVTYFGREDEINSYLTAVGYNVVIDDKSINSILIKINKKLIKLIKTSEKINDKETFIRLAFRIYKLLQNMIFPISKYEEFDNDRFCFSKYFDKLNEILDSNNLYIFNVNLLEPIIIELENLYSSLYLSNPKLKLLKETSHYKSTIVCSNSVEQKFLIDEAGVNKKEVLTVSEVNEDLENKNLIFASSYDKTKKYQIPYCQKNNICNIFYHTNVMTYNSKVRYFNKSINKILDKNLLKYNGTNEIKNIECVKEIEVKNMHLIEDEIKKDECTDYGITEHSIVQNEDIECNDGLIENYIRSNTKENYDPQYEYDINSLFQIDSYTAEILTSNVTEGLSVAKKKIIFTNGDYCYLTKNYNTLCIDKKDNAIEKNIDKLQSGEKLIFIDEKTDDDLEMLFYKIINSKIFKETYKDHYERMKYWKGTLKIYMDRYNLDYISISQELRIFNVNKTDMAVRQWINSDEIIGPREAEVYKAIARITCDEKMRENWYDIYESNNIIRGFRTKFKKTFKNMVKNSVVNKLGEDELEHLVKSVFGNLNEYANVVEIKSIEDVSEDIAYIKCNHLITMDK